MPSAYSQSLKIQLMATGENSGTWGDVTNTNLGTALEEAIVGNAEIVFAGSDVVLSLTNSNNSQPARCMRLSLVGSSGGARILEVPAIEKLYVVANGLSDAVTVKNSTGTGIAVPAGKSMLLYNDGTNVVEATNHAVALSATDMNVTGTLTAVDLDTTGASTMEALTVTTSLTPPSSTGTGAFVLAESPALTGNPTAPTQLTTDNSTRLATTAYVTSKIQASTSGLSDPGTNGVVVRTALGVTTARSLASGAGISLTNADGVAGNPTITNTGVLTVNGTAPNASGNVTVSAVSDPGSNGIMVRTASNTTVARTLTQGTGITVTNGSGTSGNPTIAINNSVVVTSVNGVSPTNGNVNVTTADGSITPAKLNGGQTGSAPAYAARAWVRFNASTGTPIIAASGNVSSITDGGVGYYRVVFTTAMPNADYAVAGTASRAEGVGNNVDLCVSSQTAAGGAPTTAGVGISTEGTGGTQVDTAYVSVIVVG